LKSSNAFDDRIFHALRIKPDSSPDWIIELVTGITHLGDGIVLAGISGITALYFVAIRRYKIAALFLIFIATAFLISAGMKSLFQRARPDEIYRLYHTTSPSFPSGHALRSTTVYMLLAGLMGMRLQRKRLLFVTGAFLAVLIGMSRIWLGVHFPSDVIAGWLIGFLIFYAALSVLRRYQHGEIDASNGE